MRNKRKRLIGGLTVLLFLFLAYIGGVLAFGTVHDWEPEPVQAVESAQEGEITVIPDSTLSFIVWNLGYGGLGAESNFFYDSGNMLTTGGRMVRAPREKVEKNMQGIEAFLGRTKSDFFLFQEVDYQSKRSYYRPQFQQLLGLMPDYYAGYAPNYKVRYVPIPLLAPWKAYGPTNSGLATLTRFQPDTSLRYQLPGAFGWPTRIFQLDRCVALHRFPLGNGRDLVVMNIHLSAYDGDGALKTQQMAFLKELCTKEYEAGNYVVVGGDWNLVPPFFSFDKFMPGNTQGYFQYNIEADFLPSDWLWVYDPRVPTNRKTRDAYQPGQTFVTLIDFYLISPNLQVESVKTLDLQFQFSDHQPVYMEVRLKKD